MSTTPTAPRSRRRDFEDNRRRILAAARLILAERGPEALTVSEVAQRAGINRSTAYQHFRTRDALAAAVTSEMAEELTGRIVESQPLWGQIEQMSLFFVDHPELARLVLHQILAESPLPERAWASYLGKIRKLSRSRDALPGIDAEMLSHVLICVGILWPLLARAQYEDAATVRRATRRLSRELGRLLQSGVLRVGTEPAPAAPNEAGGRDSKSDSARRLRVAGAKARTRRRSARRGG